MMNREICIALDDIAAATPVIGRQGENAATRLMVDCRDVLGRCPDARITLAVRPPGQADAYPAVTRVEDGVLVWDIGAADTARSGWHEIQIVAADAEGRIIKSTVGRIAVERSLTDGGDAPDPVESWIAAAEQTRADAQAAGNAADEAAQRADSAADRVAEIEILTNAELEGLLK